LSKHTINSQDSLSLLIGKLRETFKAKRYFQVTINTGKKRGINQNFVSHGWYSKISKEEAEKALEQARKDVQEMADAGFPTSNIQGILREAERAFNKVEYEEVKKIAQEIAGIRKNAFEADSIIKEVKEGIENAKSRWLDVSNTERTIELAIRAFEREDFRTSLQRAKDAQLILILETKGKVNILWFLKTYWWAILLGAALLALISLLLYSRLLIFIINQRIIYLNKEEESITSLKEEAQTKYFKEKSISSSQYSRIMARYDDRLTKIRRTRATLRNKRVGLMKTENELESIGKERKETLDMIRQEQKDYLEKGKMTRGRFLDLYKSDKARLLELDKEEAMLSQRLKKEKITKKYTLLKIIDNVYSNTYSRIKNIFKKRR